MVIAVVLNEPQGKASGGLTAAPVFRAIAAPSVHYLGLQGQVSSEDRPAYTVQRCSAQGVDGGTGYAGADVSRLGLEGSSRMPDLRSLPFRTALRVLEGFPFRIQIEGSGRIVRQEPAPGAVLRAGEVLQLVGSTDLLARSLEEGTGRR